MDGIGKKFPGIKRCKLKLSLLLACCRLFIVLVLLVSQGKIINPIYKKYIHLFLVEVYLVFLLLIIYLNLTDDWKCVKYLVIVQTINKQA